jgi:FAD/FMN-containing dehydrogenase
MMARSRQIAASYGLDVPILGHAGDGNLHPVVLYEPASWPPSTQSQKKLPTRRLHSVAL